ncbi:hypothetical protein JCM8547_007744 [Rhodosporidiobolus lusitaniae]
MSRRRSASLSRPVFRDYAASPSLDFPSHDGLDALALAGETDGPPPSRSRSNSLSAGNNLLDPDTAFQKACEPEVQSDRPVVRVRKAAPPPSSSSSSRLTPPSSSRPTPKRAMTRMIPEDPWKVNENPLEQPEFQKGLQLAGYTAPIDTSRKAIKGRFTHALSKEEFKAHLCAFLEQKGLKTLGEYMVRFQGPAAESHSPFVHVFTTTLPSDTATTQVYADGFDVQKPDLPTTWTFLPQPQAGEMHWACKARKFWPVRVVLEGPKAADVVPAEPTPAGEEDDRRSRRRKRRDTFQVEIDIDAEAKRQEELEAKELKENTKKNSVALNLSLETDVKKPPSSSSSSSRKNRSRDPAEDDAAPLTPTIIESVKQLGKSVVDTVQPAVQARVEDLRHWWQQQQTTTAPVDEEEYYDDDEERERRRRRKERRERRKREEEENARRQSKREGRSRQPVDEDAVELAEVNRMADEEEALEKAAVERKQRKEERRRRREAGEI